MGYLSPSSSCDLSYVPAISCLSEKSSFPESYLHRAQPEVHEIMPAMQDDGLSKRHLPTDLLFQIIDTLAACSTDNAYGYYPDVPSWLATLRLVNREMGRYATILLYRRLEILSCRQLNLLVQASIPSGTCIRSIFFFVTSPSDRGFSQLLEILLLAAPTLERLTIESSTGWMSHVGGASCELLSQTIAELPALYELTLDEVANFGGEKDHIWYSSVAFVTMYNVRRLALGGLYSYDDLSSVIRAFPNLEILAFPFLFSANMAIVVDDIVATLPSLQRLILTTSRSHYNDRLALRELLGKEPELSVTYDEKENTARKHARRVQITQVDSVGRREIHAGTLWTAAGSTW